MSKPKPLILVVEDEKELSNLVCMQLEANKMNVQPCYTANDAQRFLSQSYANLMLLDINLPDKSGFQLIDELKQAGNEIPIIFLTGDNSEVDRVKGLNMGGDDYIVKPFSMNELIARVNAVLRRTETAKDLQITKNVRITEEPFLFCTATVDPQRMEIRYPDGGREKIGKKQLGILSYLHSNQSTVITRKSLIHAVWGQHADVKSRSLDQYIVKIRDMLTRHNCSLDTFQTIHGVGYIYDPENKMSTQEVLSN